VEPSFITTIYKSNDMNECKNYRGISLNSCFSKLFTLSLQRRLSCFLESNQLLSNMQAGFRPGYRTTDHIYTIKTILNKYLHNQKKPVFAAFIDFSKAFDSVWRPGLFYKMLNAGIGGNFYRIIKDMYCNTRFAIKKGQYIGPECEMKKGVRQGDSLSPTLFNIYVNDIDSIFGSPDCDPVTINDIKINHLMYADDLLILSESSSGLQRCLNNLETFCVRWKLDINITKSKTMLMSKGKLNKQKFHFHIGNTNLEIVDEYRYLGVVLYFNGNMKHAAENVYNKSIKAYFALRSKLSNVVNVSMKLNLKLFDSMIKPIYTYGSEIWISDFDISKPNIDQYPFEKIHNKFCKYTLGVHKKSSNFASKCELGRLPSLAYITQQTLKFYKRIQENTTNKLLLDVFRCDEILMASGSKSWLDSIKHMEKKFNIEVKNTDKKSIKTVVNESSKQSVLNRIQHIRNSEDDKLNFFSNTYGAFQLQPYLKTGLTKSITKHLTELRISSHRLKIERGRYTRPKTSRSERLCLVCNTVEDEVHFLLDCKRVNKREELFASLNLTNKGIHFNDQEIINTICNPTDKTSTENICRFISTNMI
jgi:hypothetical protein